MRCSAGSLCSAGNLCTGLSEDAAHKFPKCSPSYFLKILTATRHRPRRRRRFSTARPERVRILFRNPWVRLRLLLWGWYVLFMSTPLLGLTPLQPAGGIHGQPAQNAVTRQLWRQLITVEVLSCQGDFQRPLNVLPLQTPFFAGLRDPTSATPPRRPTTADPVRQPAFADRFRRPGPGLTAAQGHLGRSRP